MKPRNTLYEKTALKVPLGCIDARRLKIAAVSSTCPVYIRQAVMQETEALAVPSLHKAAASPLDCNLQMGEQGNTLSGSLISPESLPKVKHAGMCPGMSAAAARGPVALQRCA